MNKLFKSIVCVATGLAMAIGVGVGTTREAKSLLADDSGLSPSSNSFIIDFYDSEKLSSTSGTNLSNSNYSSFVKVASGLTATNVVTGVSVTGTVQYGKNGGLTLGANNTNAASVVFSIGNNYAVNKITMYATIYDSGASLTVGGEQADDGTLGAKGAAFDSVTDPLIWDNLDGVTSLTVSKTGKRITVYTIVCEYSSPKTLDSIAISGDYTTQFYVGDTFNHNGVVVTATYDNGSTKDVTSLATFSSPNMSSAGNKSVTVSYTEGGVTKTANYSITVNAPRTMTSIELHGTIQKDEYYVGESWVLDGLDIKVNWSAGDPTYVDLDDEDVVYECTPATATDASITSFDIEVMYADFDETFTVEGLTVSVHALEDVLTKSNIPSAAVGSGTTAWGTASTVSDYTGAAYTVRFMGVESSSSIGRLNDSVNGYIYTSTIPTGMKLKSVSISSMTANKTVGVYAQTTAYTAAPSDKSTALGTITPNSLSYSFASGTNFKAICLRGHTSATEIGEVTIEYEAITTTPSLSLSNSTINLKTNESAGKQVTATVENVQNPAIVWTPNNNNVTIETGVLAEEDGVYTQTATIKPNSEVDASSTITVTVTGTTLSKSITVAIAEPGPGETAETPYTVAQAISAMGSAESDIENIYILGKISQIDEVSLSYHNATYYISDDGTTTNQFKIYHGKYLNNTNFTSEDQIAVGDTVIVFGTISLQYSNLNSGNYIVSLTSGKVLSSITVSGQTTEFVVGDTFEFDGIVTAHYTDDSSRDVTSQSTVSEPDMSSVGTKTVTVSYTENETQKTTTYEIVVNAAPVPTIEQTGMFVKVTDDSGLIDGAKYLIAYDDTALVFDGSRETLDASQNSVSASASLDTLMGAYFVIDSVDHTNPNSAKFIKSASGQYIGKTANSNGLDSSENTVYQNTISFDEGGNVVITASGGTTLRYNASAGEGNLRFRFYKSGQQPIQLYRFSTASATEIATIRGTAQEENGEVTGVTSLTLRFGVKIPKADWDRIQGITEYGIMMYLTSETNEATAPSVEERYTASASNVSTISKNTTDRPDEDGQGNYNFFVVVEVPDELPTAKGFGYHSYFIVRPYIMIGSVRHFLLEEDMHKSIVSLATAGNSTNLSPEALEFLASK